MQTYVVTGAAGFIGSHVCDRLLADGHAVVGVDCFTDYYARDVKEANLRGASGSSRFRLVEADLRSADLGPIVANADGVVHEAAMGGLLKSWTAFDAYLSCNVLATQRLLDALRENGGPPLVHISTSSVYGRDSSGSEDRPTAPQSPYGVTKLAAEHLVRSYGSQFGVPSTILRYFSIYGPRQRPDMGYHIFIERILANEPITLFGDGAQSRGNTFVADCVEATVRALAHGPTGETFNIGGGEAITARDAIALIGRLVGREPIVEHAPERPGEQRTALADTGKAGAVFGWAPTTGIEDGLRAQVEWQRARGAARPT